MAKRRKRIKQKGRFARFSGATSKYAIKIETALVHISDDKVRVEEIQVQVGPVKLPPHVVNTGRGPNSERMQQYYNSVNPKSFEKPIPIRTSEQMEYWLKQYDAILRETPRTNKLELANTPFGRLDLFYTRTEWFFVEVDLKQEIIRRSRDYETKKTAIDRLNNNRIAWIETLSVPKLTK